MEFEWDDARNDACFTHRGFGCSYAVRAFQDGDRIVGRDRRRDYVEDRYRPLGTMEGRVPVVIDTIRGSVVRMISARKANARETREHERSACQD